MTHDKTIDLGVTTAHTIRVVNARICFRTFYGIEIIHAITLSGLHFRSCVAYLISDIHIPRTAF